MKDGGGPLPDALTRCGLLPMPREYLCGIGREEVRIAGLELGPQLAESSRFDGRHPPAVIDLPARAELRQRLEIALRRRTGGQLPEIGPDHVACGEEAAAVRAEFRLPDLEAMLKGRRDRLARLRIP